MIRSLDVTSRSFAVLQEKQQMLSANAANASTPGYKFHELVQTAMAPGEMHHVADGEQMNQYLALGDFTPGTQIDERVTNFENGALQQTGSSTDFALQGDGFFTVAGPGGENYYTRNGQFTTNAAGNLVTLEGYQVQMNDAQPLVTNFGEQTGGLMDTGNGYFTGANGVIDAGETQIVQGYLETSNVDMADVMIDLIQIQREFEANQSVLRGSDETLRKATNEVGSVR